MLRRLAIVILALLPFCRVIADMSTDPYVVDMRKRMANMTNGDSLIAYYGALYSYSLRFDDTAFQIKCLNDLVAETRRQKNIHEEGDAMLTRAVYYYNNDINDSIYEILPGDMEILKANKLWPLYYEAEELLINTYSFDNKTTIALRKVSDLFEDAKNRKDKYGMGVSYFLMGNVYALMNNRESSSDSYQKALNIYKSLNPIPTKITDLFAYYCDVLNDLKDFAKLENVANEWELYLKDLFIRKPTVEAEEDGKVMKSYYYLARIQADLGLNKLDDAAKTLDMAESLQTEDEHLQASFLFYRAQYCLQSNDYHGALVFNNRRMAMLTPDANPGIRIQVLNQRASIMKALGRYDEASALYNEMFLLSDSISAKGVRNQLNEMNTIFQVDELKMEQERLEFEQKRAQLIWIIVVATILVISLVIFLVIRMRSARRLKEAHEELQDTHNKLLVAYDNLEETTAAKERIESDLRIARDIQMSMVPSRFPERDDLDLYASMTPAKEVGGDLYDFLVLDDHLYFCLGDVSGKGVPASLFMAQATRLFHTLAKLKMQPAEIATRLNDELGADNEQGMFVTMFLGDIDLKSGHLSFCNAGHNPPTLDGEFIDMIPNAPIGLWPGLEYEGEEIDNVVSKPLFIYTDGLNEAENRQQEQFSDERLLDMMKTNTFESAHQTVEMLKAAVETHRDGAEPNDDLTMMCIYLKKIASQ